MTILARDIMTPNVKAVPESWTMQQFARFLTDNEITGSPVTNADGEIVGIATLKDVAEFHWEKVDSDVEKQMTQEEKEETRRLRQFIFEEMSRTPVEVRDIMTPMVLSVDEATRIQDIAEIMMKEHLHRIFVEHEGEVTGIITTYDMLKIIADPALMERCLAGA
ncbi:CBS domain-containing protein [Marinobacteraceae bacterium S3BR75-40.1]